MKMIFKNPGYFSACMMAHSVHALNPMQPRCVSKATVQVRWNLRFVWLLTLAAG
jgi:hypothetical protein